MRIELVPIFVGIVVGLIGVGLLFDAWTADEFIVRRDRRRAPRIERDRNGEGAIGLGVLCMAAAFIGRDTWRYSVVAVIAGAVLPAFRRRAQPQLSVVADLESRRATQAPRQIGSRPHASH